MIRIRCASWIIFFCLWVLGSFANAQTLETVPTLVDYSPFFERLGQEERQHLEESLYSSHFVPAGHTLTAKEKIDAFIIGNFTLWAQKQHKENPSSFAKEVAYAQLSLKQAQSVLYELYGVSGGFPLDKLDQEIKDSKYNLLLDLFGRLPMKSLQIPGLGSTSMKTLRGVILTVNALTKIQDLEIKRKFLQAVDLELPTSADEIRKVYVLARRVSKNLHLGFSAQIDAFFKGDPSAISILANLDTLISHNPMIKNQVDLLIAHGKITSLEQVVLIVKKNLEEIEITVEQQQNEDEIRASYLEIRRASVGVSTILGVFDPNIQNAFNRIVNPLIDMSDAYSTLKVVTAKGIKLDTKTLAACATGIGAVFALADFFISSSRPSDMEILMEHLNSQFEKLHERFNRLHEHLDVVHRDLLRAASELFSVIQQRFDSTDRKLEEIKRVLNRHSEKLKVIEDLIRDQRNEARNIEMDKDHLAFEEDIRRYEEGMDSFEECLFNCDSYAEGVSKRRPHLRESEDDRSDIQNGFFHKVLKVPYFVNLSQLLNYSYPGLPKGSMSKVGVYDDPIERALQEENKDVQSEMVFTQADIKNIGVWVDGVNTSLQQIAAQREKDLVAGQKEKISRQISKFIVSGRKLKKSLEGIFYQLGSDFEKASVRREFVTKLLKDYIGALTQASESVEAHKSRYDAEQRISGLDVLDRQAIYILSESVVVDSPFSSILPSELKAAILLGIGKFSVSYENPRWGVVDGQEGKLLFNVIFKFQEDHQESKMIGAVTIASDQVISGYSDISPQDALNRISVADMTVCVIDQIKNKTTPNIQRQFVVENYIDQEDRFEWRRRGSARNGTDGEYLVKVGKKDVSKKRQNNVNEICYVWKGFDLDSLALVAKAEVKRQQHAEKFASDIVQDIKNDNAVFERLEGQKALLEAYLSLGLNQSFASHVYLKSFFNRIFSHELMDKEEALYFLSQSKNNPRHLLKEGLVRAKKLSCLLLGQRDGAMAVEAFETVSEERCDNDALYSPEGLLTERLNTNELPDILTKTLGRLYRAQRMFSNL